MNKTRIEWCDRTWNPVTGCWGPGGTAESPKRCWYCYAQKIENRFHGEPADDYYGGKKPDPFSPKFWPSRLSQPSKVKKPSRIFVGSMGDLFGDWVPKEWIVRTLMICDANPHHTFLFLTKNPKRYVEFTWGDNCWLGATITNQADEERVRDLLQAKAAVRFVSVEPMLGPVNIMPYLWKLCGTKIPYSERLKSFNWLIIGALTGHGYQNQPSPAWIQSLIDQAQAAGVSVFLKDNLKWPERIQEWPE